MQLARLSVIAIALTAAAAAAACDRGKPKVEVDPVTEDGAKKFGDKWVAAAQSGSCDPEKLRDMIDDAAFRARVLAHVSSKQGEIAANELDAAAAGRIVCAWQKQASDYRMLRVRAKDGSEQPLTRRLVKNKDGIVAVNYEDLMLGTSQRDHQVRVLDIYSYISGQWLSELLGDNVAALLSASTSDVLDDADNMKKAIELQKEGKPQEALALLDQLPEKVRHTRELQVMRVGVAEAIGPDAHLQAIDEMEKTFPNDPSVALMVIDGAFMHKDYDKALRDIDMVDKAIGGDPFQDAIRAQAFLARNQAGDLDHAKQAADRATKNEPTLAKGWYAEVDVALAAKRYKDALDAMDHLHEHFGAVWRDAKLRTMDSFQGLVASPEYTAWLAAHPDAAQQ